MNKTKFITIACWIISTAVLVGLVAWFISGIGFAGGRDSWFGAGFGLGYFEERTTQNVPVYDVDSMNIDWTSGRVSISRHHGSDIRITEFSQRELRDGEEFRIDVIDGTIRVNFHSNPGIFRNTPSKRLEVLIPYAFEHFDDFHVRTVSGRVNINDINALNINVSTTSGRIEASNLAAETLALNTTSGRIEIYDSNADDMNLRTVSGRIGLTNTQAENLYSRTTSGRHYLSGTFNDITARSVSGRIEVISSIVPANLTVNTTSGRIEVMVPNEGEPISVQYSLRSGRFSSDIPVITGVNYAQFQLSSTSGRISIYRLD